jgi:hypothetical protein
VRSFFHLLSPSFPATNIRSSVGEQLRYCGNSAGFEEVIIKGNVTVLKVCVSTLCPAFLLAHTRYQFIAYYIKQGKVVAVAW